MFLHNGANGPESKTTHMFRPVRQVAAPGASSAVANYILLRNVKYDHGSSAVTS